MILSVFFAFFSNNVRNLILVSVSGMQLNKFLQSKTQTKYQTARVFTIFLSFKLEKETTNTNFHAYSQTPTRRPNKQIDLLVIMQCLSLVFSRIVVNKVYNTFRAFFSFCLFFNLLL